MPDDQRDLAVIMVKLEALIGQVSALVNEVRTDYVRKETYDARHTGLTRRVDDLEREADDREKARLAFQRQILGGIVVGGFLMLAQTAVTVILVMGGIK